MLKTIVAALLKKYNEKTTNSSNSLDIPIAFDKVKIPHA
jgi:hypothetical protein